MKKGLRKILAVTISIFGSLLAVYVGVYWLLLRPVGFLVVGLAGGGLTKSAVVVCILKILLASTAAGAIWCIFDIIAGKFRDE